MKDKALNIVKKLQDNGYDAVYAGGSVRDMLLGHKPHDYDIATNALPEKVEELFDLTLPIGKTFGVVVVMMDGDPFEVATFRTDGEYLDGRHPSKVTYATIQEDAERRDFTINAMFYDPIEDHFIDLVDGKKDLENKNLRFVGDSQKRIDEDKLRMLRAVRFAVRFDMKIEDESFQAIVRNSHKIHEVSNERIQDELSKLFRLGESTRALDLLWSSGLLKQVLPEVANMKGCPQEPKWHPEGDVFEHTKIVMDLLFEENEDLKDETIWATLLHDIGKPPVTVYENGRVRSRAHEFVGADMAKERLKELKFSTKFIELVYNLIHDHMRIKKATKMRTAKLKRMLAQPYLVELMQLCRADSLSSTKMIEWYDYINEKLDTFEPEEIKPPRLIDGHDLIELGLEPGPIFRELLEDVTDKQLEDVLKSKEDAIRYIKEKIDN